jgi:RsiW-degrading membrane proteinase PrsW (M82 family)
MIRLVILLAAVAPALLTLSYGIAKTRGSWRSEAMWNAFLVGAVSGLAVAGIELVISAVLGLDRVRSLSGAAQEAIFVAAIPEESIKFLVLVALAEKHVGVRRLQDIIVLGVAVSLGFAALENFCYVAAPGNWQQVAALRAMTAVPGHGIDGLMMGALLAAARLYPGRDPSRFILALLVPVVSHAAYDFPAIAIQKGIDRGPLTAVWIVVVLCSSIVAIVLCNRVLVKVTAADQAAGRDGYSIETTDLLMVGGLVSLFGGPMLAGAVFSAMGLEYTTVVIALGVLPIVLGVDAIFTGLARRRERDAREFNSYFEARHDNARPVSAP